MNEELFDIMHEKINDMAFNEIRSISNKGYNYAIKALEENKLISRDEANKNIRLLIDKLHDLGINMDYLGEESSNDNFTDKTFVITGTLSRGRDEIKDKIESFGGKVSDSVSKKTDYLVLGDNPGSKYDKALALGIKIIHENELDDMFNN